MMAEPYYSASDIVSMVQTVGGVIIGILAAYAAMKSKLAVDQGKATAEKTAETEGKVTEAAAKLDAIKEQNDGHQSRLIDQLEQYHKLVVAMAARMPAEQVLAAKSDAAAPAIPLRRATDAVVPKPDTTPKEP